MARHCSICAHPKRAEIDQQLAQHACNVSALARELGVARMALNRHRESHVTSFLRIYGNAADLPTLGELHGELLRLHTAALDNLANAERGRMVWEVDVDEDGRELLDSNGRKLRHRVRRYDPTVVARCVAEARKVVDRISMLAADASRWDERPSGSVAGELGARIAEQLERLNAKQNEAVDPHIDRAREVDALPDGVTARALRGASAGAAVGGPTEGEGVAGEQAVSTPVLAPPQVPRDAAIPSEIQALSPRTRAVLSAHEDTDPTIPKRADNRVILTIPNPHWNGSPAASGEERAQAGFPDIELTLADLKARPDIVQALATRED